MTNATRPCKRRNNNIPAKSAEDFFFFTHAPETTGAAPTLGHRSRASQPQHRNNITRQARKKPAMPNVE